MCYNILRCNFVLLFYFVGRLESWKTGVKSSDTVPLRCNAKYQYSYFIADENCNLFSISKYGLKEDKWTKIGKTLSTVLYPFFA